MAKVPFDARKLLRDPPAATPTADAARDELAVEAAPERARPARTTRPNAAASPAAVEAPAGVIAIAPPAVAPSEGAERRVRRRAPSPAAGPRPTHARRVARRVQTSIALHPDAWGTLDELAADAGVSVGALLVAILTVSVPESADAALSAVEELLRTAGPDEVLHEERNYRLALDLRAQLDALAATLGSGRPQRSLLVRALVAAHTPTSAEQARELITTQRIDTMRASLRAAADN
jgi:hypothetical protein